MRLLLHTMACPDRDPEGALELAAELGLDGIELACQTGYRCAIAPDAPASEASRLAAHARRLGLEVAALVPYAKGMNAADPVTREQAVRQLDHCLSLADAFGASAVRVFGGAAVESDDRLPAIRRIGAALGLLGARACALGVAMCVENHMDTMATSAASTMEIVEAISHSAFGVLYDQANLDQMGAEPFPAAFERQREAIRHVHVKDFRWSADGRRVAALPGQGVVPWAGIIAALAEARYDGFLSLEYEKRWFPDELPAPEAGLVAARDFVQRLVRDATLLRAGREAVAAQRSGGSLCARQTPA